MSLHSLNLPPLLNTSDHDLIADFFVPALSHAWRYDRGVGYFSSGWLRLAARGIVMLAYKLWVIALRNQSGFGKMG